MIFEQEIVTNGASETARLGRELAQELWQKRGEGGPVSVCLYGELGSGKTTFAQGFAKGLGLTSRLLSPTFIIVRRYSVPQRSGFFYHLDLYRIKDKGNLLDLGLSEIFHESGSFAVVEWAEKLETFLPKQRIDVDFKVGQREEHLITLKRVNYD